MSDRGGPNEANAWDTLAYAHHHLGNFGRAHTCYLRAIGMLRRNGDRYNEAGSLTRLGDTHAATGDDAAARAVWAQATDILTEIDPPWAAEVRAKLQTSPFSADGVPDVTSNSGDVLRADRTSAAMVE
jgi:hypothetical protein